MTADAHEGAPEGAEDGTDFATRALVDLYGRPFSRGEVFFREGEASTTTFLLHTGRVRLLKRVRAVEQSIAVLKAGDLFGEGALAEGGARSSTAVALSDGEVIVLDPSALRHVARDFPDTSERIVRHLIRRLGRAEDQVEILMLRDPSSKVVSALLKMTKPGASSAELPISPVELSSRVGLDVETVKRTVQKLRSQDYVRITAERIEIPDVEALRKLYRLLGAKDELRVDR